MPLNPPLAISNPTGAPVAVCCNGAALAAPFYWGPRGGIAWVSRPPWPVCAHVYFGGLPTATGLFAVLVYFCVAVAPLPALDFLPTPWRTGARPLGLAGLGGRVSARLYIWRFAHRHRLVRCLGLFLCGRCTLTSFGLFACPLAHGGTGARPLGLAGLGGRVSARVYIWRFAHRHRLIRCLGLFLCGRCALTGFGRFACPLAHGGAVRGAMLPPLPIPSTPQLSGPAASLAVHAGLGARYRHAPCMTITGSASCLTAPPTVATSARQRGAGSH